MNLGFREEVQAGDLNLGTIYVQIVLQSYDLDKTADRVSSKKRSLKTGPRIFPCSDL